MRSATASRSTKNYQSPLRTSGVTSKCVKSVFRGISPKMCVCSLPKCVLPETHANFQFFLKNALHTFGRNSRITEFTGRSQALLSLANSNYFFEFSKVDFISNENQIKVVLYGMSPKIAIFCSISVEHPSSDRCETWKKDTGHVWALVVDLGRFLPPSPRTPSRKEAETPAWTHSHRVKHSLIIFSC